MLHLREGEYLRRAAVLLFHPAPVPFFARAFVKNGYFRTETELARPSQPESRPESLASRVLRQLAVGPMWRRGGI